MIGYGVGVAATMARTRVPELIAEALRPAAETDASEAMADASTSASANEAPTVLESAS
jgi:hypothetical protein